MQQPKVGRKNAVRIATLYGLGDPEIEFQLGQSFPHPSIPALGPIQPPILLLPGLFPGSKTARAWRRPPTPI
jgi:hypothetical protein